LANGPWGQGTEPRQPLPGPQGWIEVPRHEQPDGMLWQKSVRQVPTLELGLPYRRGPVWVCAYDLGGAEAAALTAGGNDP